MIFLCYCLLFLICCCFIEGDVTCIHVPPVLCACSCTCLSFNRLCYCFSYCLIASEEIGKEVQGTQESAGQLGCAGHAHRVGKAGYVRRTGHEAILGRSGLLPIEAVLG